MKLIWHVYFDLVSGRPAESVSQTLLPVSAQSQTILHSVGRLAPEVSCICLVIV